MSFARHWQIMTAALKDDRERRRNGLRSHEIDFLPAALEVIEKPVSPTVRITVWVLMIGLAITAAWLFFGRVDVVVSAEGIVPSSDGLEVEARILNKDAGFVHEGQPVAVKLEAFPFTRYGTVPGVVKHISRDAVPDQKLGSVYLVTIGLAHGFIEVDRRDVPLTSGLAATADIRTGSRRIITYLLSPLQTTVAQAGHER